MDLAVIKLACLYNCLESQLTISPFKYLHNSNDNFVFPTAVVPKIKTERFLIPCYINQSINILVLIVCLPLLIIPLILRKEFYLGCIIKVKGCQQLYYSYKRNTKIK